MSTLLTEPELKQAIGEGRLVIGGKSESVEGLKYDFSLGSHMLFGRQAPIDAEKLSEQQRAELVVKPGELVYVMSQEQLDLPPDVKAELSPKRKVSHLGIMVLGGFCVDPGYKGYLVFAIYNLSTRPFPLQIGRKLIAAQFYRLQGDEVPPPSHPEPLYEFPSELVQLMQVYEPATSEGLRQQVGELSQSLEDLRRQVQTKEEWFDRYQRSLDAVTQNVAELTVNVDKLREGLREEVDSRKETAKEFATLRTRLATNNVLFVVLVAGVSSIITGVIVAVVVLLLTGHK
jgi:deoxycytidine triphosphate deaminase